MDLKEKLTDKLCEVLGAIALIVACALALFVIFSVGIVFFTVFGFVIVFLIGLLVGFWLASKLLLRILKE